MLRCVGTIDTQEDPPFRMPQLMLDPEGPTVVANTFRQQKVTKKTIKSNSDRVCPEYKAFGFFHVLAVPVILLLFVISCFFFCYFYNFIFFNFFGIFFFSMFSLYHTKAQHTHMHTYTVCIHTKKIKKWKIKKYMCFMLIDYGCKSKK